MPARLPARSQLRQDYGLTPFLAKSYLCIAPIAKIQMRSDWQRIDQQLRHQTADFIIGINYHETPASVLAIKAGQLSVSCFMAFWMRW